MDEALAQLVPGYREAVEKESAARDAAFIETPRTICGVDVLPLTLHHLVLLSFVRSPFIVGGVPDGGSVVQFLWITSPQFKPSDINARDVFIADCRKLPFVEAVTGIKAHVDAAFSDFSVPSGPSAASIASHAAYLVDAMASEYHWSEQEIRTMPLARIAQYIRIIRRRNDPKAIFVNPSDHIVSAHYRAKNAARLGGVN